MILYSAKSTIDKDGQSAYRITKFVDGEVESSYLTTFETCECPAGGRHTCRHREMIGIMIAEDIVNTHWFWNHDRGTVVDFSGAPTDPLLRHPDLPAPADIPRAAYDLALATPAFETSPASEALQGSLPLEDKSMTAECPPGCCEPFTPATPEPAPQTQPSWRRL